MDNKAIQSFLSFYSLSKNNKNTIHQRKYNTLCQKFTPISSWTKAATHVLHKPWDILLIQVTVEVLIKELGLAAYTFAFAK